MGTSYNPKIVTNGLVLHLDAANKKSYPGAGTSWVDLSKNKYNFTTYGSPVYSTSRNGILTFAKASSQYAEYSTLLPNLSSWTAEIWVNFTSLPSATSGNTIGVALFTGIFDNSTKINFTIGCVVTGSADIYAAFYNGAWRNTSSGHTPSTGQWYCYTGTYDGALLSLYVNGLFFSSLSYVGTPQSGGGVRVARRWDNSVVSGNLFDGSASSAKLYNRALSATEVLQNYNASKGRFIL